MKRILAVAALSLSVTACDYWKDLVGDDRPPPLPGDRISILSAQRSLTPDPQLASAEILLPAPAPTVEWPQPGGYPNNAMHHIAVNEQLAEAWSTDIGTGADDVTRIPGSPVVAGGVVFAMDAESQVSAFRLEDGREIWQTELVPEAEEDDEHISGGVAYYRGRVFAATGFNEVVALAANSGEIVWRTAVEAPLRSAPTAWENRVLVTTIDNQTYALDVDTGEQVWRHNGIPETAALLGGASPAAETGVVVVPYTSGELVALRSDTGRVLWTDSLSSISRTDIVSGLAHIRGRPVIDRGRVIAISHGGLMAAFDLRTGRRLWEREIGGSVDPWVAGDYVFVITNESELAALSRETGQVYWVASLPRFEDPEDQEDKIVWSGPILASDRLIVTGSHGLAWALSPYSGRFIGEVEMPSGVTVPPVVADGHVLFLADDGELVVYR